MNFSGVELDKVIFVMGSTATGKTRLSVALATQFSAEIINSDKIQVYKGLDIITNKVSSHETRGVPHHLLGFLDPDEDFTAQEFCRHTMMTIHRIIEKGRIPIIVGGSNNYIRALVEDPTIQFRKNFDCCFLWMDVSLPVLHRYVGKRVDNMVELGLVDEVREMFDPEADYTRGIRRAIGAPEMHKYLEIEGHDMVDEATKKILLNAAIEEIKDNTCKLVNCQLEKIRRLRDELGWEIHRIDATPVFENNGKKEAEEAWENAVMKPSLKIVGNFLKEKKKSHHVESSTYYFQVLLSSSSGNFNGELEGQ
ncbi:adenylate isopentenyltransferase 5, chloroplastic-like [Pistacia vera]|uniref:adenylate isopentenyltransferase 5, chloroplastic-like n=1 Tax=Pistacia vera TaxID=55513 RepID=UPI001262C220|nr:adenylate isopentenyltransferase 5, chloroplastic-like [Pistacia vera]